MTHPGRARPLPGRAAGRSEVAGADVPDDGHTAPRMERAPVAVWGVVNATPDSFSDGGRALEASVDHGLRLLDEGADVLDVGGESTRPGAQPVDVEEELARVLPVLTALRRRRPDATLSVDTRRAEVARAAIDAGAAWVNDVSGGADPAMGPLVARAGVRWVLMHLRGDFTTMQQRTDYVDLVAEVEAFLAERLARAEAAGVPRERLWIDPGVGFGKAWADNPRLIAATGRLSRLAPVLVGASRKAFIGQLTGVQEPGARVHGSVGAALAAAANGAAAVRVHDVAATVQALAVFRACGGVAGGG